MSMIAEFLRDPFGNKMRKLEKEVYDMEVEMLGKLQEERLSILTNASDRELTEIETIKLDIIKLKIHNLLRSK